MTWRAPWPDVMRRGIRRVYRCIATDPDVLPLGMLHFLGVPWARQARSPHSSLLQSKVLVNNGVTTFIPEGCNYIVELCPASVG